MSCCPEHKSEAPMVMSHGGPDAGSGFLRRFFVVAILLVPLFLFTPTGLSIVGLSDFAARRYIQFLAATAIFSQALVFFEHARHEIAARKYGMMTLVSLAVGAGFAFSAASTFLPVFGGAEFYIEIATLIWVLLFGHFLEARSSAAAGSALAEVAKLLPKQAHRIVGGKITDIDVAELKENDIVLVKPGEKIPADGVIVKGSAGVDESLISGESKPVEKEEGSNVVAGSVCLDGSLEVRLSRVGENSTIGQIQKLVARAAQTKPATQKIADKAASALTFAALAVSLLTIFVWTLLAGQSFVFALTLAITVLVIACPHALGLAIPTVTTIATTLAVKSGLFVKDLAKLEAVKDVDTVVFDKTGTLTKGEFGVTDIIEVKSQRGVLLIAASLEQNSSHFIAQSVVRAAKEKNIELLSVSNFKNIAGKGVLGVVEGIGYLLGNKAFMEENNVNLKGVGEVADRLSSEGKTVIYLAGQNGMLGVLALSDVIKNESLEAISDLHRLGIKVAMITGDNEHAARNVAKNLSIDSVFANVLPQDKYKHIKELQEKGRVVMMVGDGVNDAPALMQANVGVAVGAGTDVAVEAGDIVLTRSNPRDIVSLVLLSRKVYRKMVENLAWATGYNILAIPAAAGLFAPWGLFLRPEWGAILMSLSSVIVVLNALTLRKAVLKV